MTHELLYTSAPRGLRPGSSGYCVVSQTAGTPRALAERLEGLSVYRHVAIGPDPAASGNPVAVAHAVVSAAGRTYHVLSRIADTGLDHTGRSNFLAHHVALGGAVPPQGPAAVCASWPFEAAWDGDVGERGPVPPPPPAANEPRACALWEEATGDAGWGGALAAATDPTDPATVVYAPGQDVLALLGEALALLPPEERWRVTFNTYYTKGAGECQWRCVPTGSPEARAALAARRGLVVRADLHDPAQPPPDGRLVTAARTGVVPSSRRPIAPTPPLESRGLTAGYAPRRLGAAADPGIAPDPNEPDTPQELEDRPAPRRAQFAPPAAPPARGSGPLVLGLGLGALVAVVALLLVEVGAQASLLRLAGVKGKDEAEAEKAREDAVRQYDDLKAQNQKDADALRKRLGDAQQKVDDLVKQVAGFPQQLAEASERAAKVAVEEYMARHPAPPKPGGGGPLVNIGVGAIATENKRLRDENKKLREQLKQQPKEVQPPPVPVAQAVTTGLPTALTTDGVHVLAELPAGKYSIDLFGIDEKALKREPGEANQIVLSDPKERDYSATIQVSESGVLSVRGRKLSRHPYLGFALLRVQAEGRPPLHFYLFGPKVQPKGELSTTGGMTFVWSSLLSDFTDGANVDLREHLQEPAWSGTAAVNLRGKLYRLSAVAGAGGDKRVLAHSQTDPGPNDPSKIVLSYDPGRKEIKLVVDYIAPQDKRPVPLNLEADLVREIKGPDGKPIRQTVISIR